MTSKTWTLVAVILGSGLVFLDTSIVSVALPKMGQTLPTSLFGVLEAQSYVYNGYLLTLSALLILAGALSDRFGRRRIFALGLVGFGLTSALCGLAPNFEMLVLFRLLQGVAGALLVPGSLALITTTFEGEERGRAFGIWAGASAVTTILGPVLGGVLVDTVSWRAAFLINVPLVLPALWATLRHVVETRDEEAPSAFDWRGALVAALAIGGLSFGGIYGQQRDWRDPLAFVALAVGAAAMVAFPYLMARTEYPLVPLHLFRLRNFSVTNVSTLLIYGALYVSLYYVPLFMQGTLGYTAVAAGIALVIIDIPLALFSTKFGALAARYGPRRYMAGGPFLMAAALLWLVRTPASSAAWELRIEDPATYLPPVSYLVDFLPSLLLFGIGLTVMVAPLTTALMASIPERNAGVASAINNAISRVGPQLAGAAIFVAITAVFYSSMSSYLPGLDTSSPELRARVAPLNAPAEGVPTEQVAAARAASGDAFATAMVASAALLLLGAATNYVGIRDRVTVPAGTAVEAAAPAAGG